MKDMYNSGIFVSWDMKQKLNCRIKMVVISYCVWLSNKVNMSECKAIFYLKSVRYLLVVSSFRSWEVFDMIIRRTNIYWFCMLCLCFITSLMLQNNPQCFEAHKLNIKLILDTLNRCLTKEFHDFSDQLHCSFFHKTI